MSMQVSDTLSYVRTSNNDLHQSSPNLRNNGMATEQTAAVFGSLPPQGWFERLTHLEKRLVILLVFSTLLAVVFLISTIVLASK